ncbi:hypothetical protein [Croceivirga sp. JEA036]|uniref:hypothetical protein n=1 Tax=Croceivirga sp. JEA036 TaxID=2721162 RepID=UPI0014393EB1|nr:hypothetical protein [Croceivirga sp. JEA036]NJB37789.1 hypothetical protein [Croceivirga sp. JEA036]
MKKISILFMSVALSLLAACSSEDDSIVEDADADHDHNHEEIENVSLLVTDVNSTTLNFINPFSEEVKTFEASHAKGSVYVTESGRYGVITHRNHNFTETFNLGGEIDHGDHSHDLGETGLAAISFESEKPTHFKSEQGIVAVYNDGDATLSLFKENTIDSATEVETITTGTTAHHGAMVIFKNGTIAVTNLGAGAGLPEKVHIINQQGEVVSEEEQSLSTSGIHGSAGNDDTAIFGSNTGVLVVKDDGEQKLINYPDTFEEDVWFGSLLATSESNLFVGYTGSKGVYFVDIDSEQITPILETEELFKCMVSKDGEKVVAVTKTGEFKIVAVASNETLYNGTLAVAMDTESSGHGSVTSVIDYFEEFLYISVPSSNKIVQYHLEEMEVEQEFELSITPYQFKVLAYDLEH